MKQWVPASHWGLRRCFSPKCRHFVGLFRIDSFRESSALEGQVARFLNAYPFALRVSKKGEEILQCWFRDHGDGEKDLGNLHAKADGDHLGAFSEAEESLNFFFTRSGRFGVHGGRDETARDAACSLWREIS